MWNGVLVELVEQAWEMGESELVLIHMGTGAIGVVNTNTGFFGRSGRLRTKQWRSLNQRSLYQKAGSA